jgi:hypothetical protein
MIASELGLAFDQREVRVRPFFEHGERDQRILEATAHEQVFVSNLRAARSRPTQQAD